MKGKAIVGRAPAAVLVAGMGAVLVASALGCAGCRQKQGSSDLEQFQAAYESLPQEQQIDTLRVLSEGQGRTAAMASFALGNVFYRQASERAAEVGWNTPEAGALLDSAQGRLERAVALDTTFVEALVNLGSVHDDRALALAPDTEHQLEKRQQLNEAEQLYKQALIISPDDTKAHNNLGSLYQREGRTSEAMAQFQTVLANDPGDALAHYNLAILFAEERIYREAIREWELAVKCDPEGDIGQRSRENIRIVNQLLQAETPSELSQPEAPSQP